MGNATCAWVGHHPPSIPAESPSCPLLGCAFRPVFRFILVLIFRNSGFSAEFPDSGGTHIGIKSFQGKINLLRNSGPGIPDPEFRIRNSGGKDPWPLPQYHIVLPFFCNLPIPFNNVACGAWSAIAIVSTDSRCTPPATSPASRCWNRTLRKDQEHWIQGAHVYTTSCS